MIIYFPTTAAQGLLLQVELYIINRAPVTCVCHHVNANSCLAVLDFYIADYPLMPIVPAGIGNNCGLLALGGLYHQGVVMLAAAALSPAGYGVLAVLQAGKALGCLEL